VEFRKIPDGGLFFRLEQEDWKADWKTFIEAVKMNKCQYKPKEMPADESWWYAPPETAKEVMRQYKILIFDMIHQDQQELFPEED
jgi:hypothetical protein